MKIYDIVFFIEIFIATFLIVLIVDMFIIKWTKKYGILLDKDNTSKPQKMHDGNIPRAGGIGIAIGIVVALLFGVYLGYINLQHKEFARTISRDFGYLLFIIPLGFVFISGILEDFHNSISPKKRLLLQILGASVAIWLFNSVVVDIGFVMPFAIGVAFSVFAITGVINALNIIDGFNGLSSGFSIMVLISITCVSYIVGDYSIFYISIMCIGAILGFMILNFPKGNIFLGDGGAYIIGFLLAYLLIKLTQENGVSAYYGLCVMIYPIFEVLFSAYRRRLVRGTSAMQPDSIHFHTLIFKRLTRSNYKTSIFIWLFNVPFVFLPILFFNNIFVLLALIVIFIALYLFVYFKIIKFGNLKL